MTNSGNTLTLAAAGCSGEVSHAFVEGFLKQGVRLRILARDPVAVQVRYPGATVIQGSMMNPGDVARVMDGVDAAFVVTPMGVRNNPRPEVQAANAVIAGAKASQLKHLVYTSVLGADHLTGVGILDAKHDIERMLADSGVPWTALRCGSYMEDVFDLRLPLLNKGKFLFPLNKDRRFTYTCQRDVPRFVVEKLLADGQAMNRPLDFVAPGTFSIRDVERLLTHARGAPVRAASRLPTYHLYMSMLPVFWLRGHRFSSILPLLRHFDRCGYADCGTTVQELYPDFGMTSLSEHLRGLWAR